MVLFKYMTIYGSMGYSDRETKEALRLITSGTVQRDLLVTHTLPLNKVSEAFHVQGRVNDSLKVVLVNE